MDPIHIHNLLRQITSEVKCPHCDARVRPDMILVENSTYNYCMLRIQCHSCSETFYGHAHVGVKVLESHGTQQKVTSEEQFHKLLPPPPPVSESDLFVINTTLKSRPSVSGLFSKPKS